MTKEKSSQSRRSGQSLLEFTFVGIPLIFVLISVFEMSRGMWMYHTLAYSVKVGVRYASVHGANCANNGNTCTVTRRDIAAKIREAAIGLDPASTKLSFFVSTFNGTKIQQGAACSLATNDCPATVWPPDGLNQVDKHQLAIDIITPFNSALAMLWPGSAPVSFMSANLGATSLDTVKY